MSNVSSTSTSLITSNAATSQIDGLVSNLNTTDIINRLLEVEKQPQDQLKAQLAQTKTVVSAYQALNTKLQALHTTARDLGKPSAWTLAKATSSNTAVAGASATAGAPSAALSFTVDKVATGNALVSAGSVASTASPIYTGHLLLSTARSLGFATLAGDQTLALGDHTVSVTQSTTAASRTGSGALAASTIITNANNTIDATVNGAVKTYTIANGTYTAAQLAAAVQTASNGDLTATLDTSGKLVLSTVREGSQADLQLANTGTANGVLSLTDFTAAVGTDGKVSVDGNPDVIVNNTSNPLVLAGSGGNVTATFAAGLRVGTVTAKNVDTLDGSMQSVATAINAAGAGINAAAVQTSPGNFRLQLSSASTGVNGTVTLAANTFSPALGNLQTLTAAQDASITVGSGPAAYTVTSSTNAVSGVLAGVTINVASTGAATVTISQDGAGIADKVEGLFNATNEVLQFIKDNSSFDTDTNTGGPLLGDFAVRRIAERLVTSVVSGVTRSSLGNPAAVGFSTTKDGLLNFDKDKFQSALAANPSAVQSLFTQGGVATDPAVSALSVTDRAQAGTPYSVIVTAAAEQAKVTGGVVAGGAITNPETITVRIGTTTASYSALAGASLTSIADGLNKALLAQGLGVVASVQANQLSLTTPNFGSGLSFEVESSTTGAGQTQIVGLPNVFETHQGVDVAGSINGVTANGTGQALVAPLNDPILQGLALRITATSPGNYGTFTVDNGAAQRIATDADAASAIDIGSLTNNITSRKSLMDDLNARIADWDRRLAQRQQTLRAQFTAMETALSTMKQQSQWLAGQINQIQASSASKQ